MERHQKKIFLAIILSEGMHIFCCVLPTLFSVASLLAGAGMVSALPLGVTHVHDALHAAEVPMILFSAVVLALGWGLYAYSRRIDCHDTGCHHGACTPKKNRTLLVLKIATALFVMNLFIYLVFHRGLGILQPATDMDAHSHSEQPVVVH